MGVREVAALLAELRGLSEAPAPDARLFEDIGLTSFDMMVVCMRPEEASGHALSFDRLADVRTVADLAGILD